MNREKKQKRNKNKTKWNDVGRNCNHQTCDRDSLSWVLVHQLIGLVGQKVKGQGHRVTKCEKHTEDDLVAGVSYALYLLSSSLMTFVIMIKWKQIIVLYQIWQL